MVWLFGLFQVMSFMPFLAAGFFLETLAFAALKTCSLIDAISDTFFIAVFVYLGYVPVT